MSSSGFFCDGLSFFASLFEVVFNIMYFLIGLISSGATESNVQTISGSILGCNL